jgi:hypothetical protein
MVKRTKDFGDMSKQSAMNKMQGKGDKEVNYIG